MKKRMIFNLFALVMIVFVAIACQKDYEAIVDPTSQTVTTTESNTLSNSKEELRGITRPCICSHVYAPVCGDDGRVYSNACRAICAGVDYYDCNPLLD